MSDPDRDLDRAPGTGQPWSDQHTRTVDLALVGALLLPVLVFPFARSPLLAAVLSVAQIAPLVVRRLYPVACFATVTAVMVLQVVVTDRPDWGQVAMPVAIYSVAAFADRRSAQVALAVGLAGAVVGPWDWVWTSGIRTPQYLLVGLVLISVIVVASWALGTLAHTRRAYVAELIDRGHRIEREAAQQAELAAAEERNRIAREMHDVVAHGLSVMIVQADGARYAVDADPNVAAAALETIASTGRESLAEMRRMLGLLRSDDTDTGTAPQPGVADLPALLEEATAAGMRLTADLPDPAPVVSPGIGVTVYRIVQEALTNVRKHAGPGAEVHVSLRVIGDDLLLEVLDDGRGAAASATPDDGQGNGLVGMRERIAVHGGHVDAGPRSGGGFSVRGRIPLLFKAGRL